MATPYTGNPTATQSPAGQPTPGEYPIVVIPDDTDACNVTTMFFQQYKVFADYIAYLQQICQGFGTNSFFLYDDFTGSITDRGIWAGDSGATYPNDPTLGGLGLLKLDDDGMSSAPLVLRTKNFSFEFRARWPNYATADSGSSANGLVNLSTAASNVYFRAYRSAGTTHNISLYEGTTEYDSGVAVNTATFATFNVTRIGNVLTWKINNTVVRTNNSFTTDFDYAGIFLTSASSGTSRVLYCDYVRLTLPSRT